MSFKTCYSQRVKCRTRRKTSQLGWVRGCFSAERWYLQAVKGHFEPETSRRRVWLAVFCSGS